MAKGEKENAKKEAAGMIRKDALLIDVKALPVVERKIVNRRTIDLVSLDSVIDLVNRSG